MTSQKEQPLVRSFVYFFLSKSQNVSSFGFRVFASKKGEMSTARIVPKPSPAGDEETVWRPNFRCEDSICCWCCYE